MDPENGNGKRYSNGDVNLDAADVGGAEDDQASPPEKRSGFVRRLNDSIPEAGLLAGVSNVIDDHLKLFRAGAGTVMVGSGLAVVFVLYRRGLHGFSSSSQVPASYFERRKRVRVRVAKIETRPTTATCPQFEASTINERVDIGRDGDDETDSSTTTVSDVILHAEHITLLRRLLRLPPRSLMPVKAGKATYDADTFTLRLCGVSATEGGIQRASEELAKPLRAQYCDAELLFREHRRLGQASVGYGLGDGGTGQALVTPVAVCNIHRRSDSFWKSIVFRSKIDPKAGYGETLLANGLGFFREEPWFGTERSKDNAPAPSGDGVDANDVLPVLHRLKDDLERLTNAEATAKEAQKGLWGGDSTRDGLEDGQISRKSAYLAKAGAVNVASGIGRVVLGLGRGVVGMFRRVASKK